MTNGGRGERAWKQGSRTRAKPYHILSPYSRKSPSIHHCFQIFPPKSWQPASAANSFFTLFRFWEKMFKYEYGEELNILLNSRWTPYVIKCRRNCQTEAENPLTAKKTSLDIVSPCYVFAQEICFKHDFSHEAHDSSPPELDKKCIPFSIEHPKSRPKNWFTTCRVWLKLSC